MLNIEETLKNLKKIKEISKEAIEIDDNITIRVKNDIRAQIHDNVKRHIDKIIEFGLKEAQINQTTEGNIVVLSDYQVQSPKRRGHFQTCAPDDLVVIPIIQSGEMAWAQSDTKNRRFLYLDEFESRCKVLLEAIMEGTLDNLLSETPNELIHKVMGQTGELLQILDIDLQKSLTYKRIINIIATRATR